jgi:hypothetical protein
MCSRQIIFLMSDEVPVAWLLVFISVAMVGRLAGRIIEKG